LVNDSDPKYDYYVGMYLLQTWNSVRAYNSLLFISQPKAKAKFFDHINW